MSRVRRRRIYWELPGDTDLEATEIYVGDPNTVDFLAQVDAGTIPAFGEVPVPSVEFFLGEGDLPEGRYQFAVAARDASQNYSDPYQHPDWVNVPLDLTAPGAPFGGGIEVV